MAKTPSVPEELVDHLRAGQRFVLTSHLNPDGDAIGSEIGLSRLLASLGKEATIWNRDPTPGIYQPLPNSDRIHVGPEPPPGFPDRFSSFLILECPQPERTGLEDFLDALPVVNIDHHLGNEEYGALNWIDTRAPAVGAMVLRLARALDIDVDPETANALYLTLVTDTGGFRFSNATPEAFEAAAALVRQGARPEVVTRWLFESQPESMIRLLGEMLRSLELHGRGRLATARLSRDMLDRCRAQAGDTEGLIDYPRSIRGVEAVALFRQLEDGRIKVSLRSRGAVDVQQIAGRHGGGGHKNAAGFSSDLEEGTLVEQTIQSLLTALEE